MGRQLTGERAACATESSGVSFDGRRAARSRSSLGGLGRGGERAGRLMGHDGSSRAGMLVGRGGGKSLRRESHVEPDLLR